MIIKLITVGKIKEKFLRLGIEEFSKRLSRYCELEQTEVQDEKVPETLSEKEMVLAKDKEGERILAQVKENTFLIPLAIEGKMLSSEELADKLKELTLSGKSHITFVIGGSLGLSEKVLRAADFKLSFSKMTFPHQLMKLILLEQIYRGFKIIKNEPYHK
ncbi:MAG: 23S rRNA (pseudouridine(1915)-N(3))-methyltransferase RlmH [Peptostreptococcales bacterium]|jgi:23S rRNA (pseudouridine1915-N3)-methyltransferase